jgi:hypothetical protein
VALLIKGFVAYYNGTQKRVPKSLNGAPCKTVQTDSRSTFFKTKPLLPNPFCIINNAVFFNETDDKYNAVEGQGADPKTFIFNGYAYGKDAHGVYYRNTALSEADPATFVVLDEWGYARDASHAWFGGALMYNVDAATFVSLGHGFAKDKKHVYQDVHVVANADPVTFTPLSEFYAKDAHHVFAQMHINDQEEMNVIENADLSTFTALGNYFYAKDSHGFYCKGAPFTIADPKTFVLIGNLDVAKDATNVYDECTIVKNANPANCSLQNISACNVPRLKDYKVNPTGNM